MKAGLGADGRVVRSRRIITADLLGRAESALVLSSDDSHARDTYSPMVKRRSSLEAAEIRNESRRGSRSLQARKTIQNVHAKAGGLVVSGGVLEKTMDPRTLARIEFEEAKQLAKEFHMDFAEVKQVIEIFYASDEDETGGLDKKELERALARVYDVHVVPAHTVEEAWKVMIGKRPMAMERLLDEVGMEAFFHWYVENVGNRVVSRSVRRRPSLVTKLTSSASASAVASRLPPSVARLLPDIKMMTSPLASTPSTTTSSTPSKSPSKEALSVLLRSDGDRLEFSPSMPSLPTLSVSAPLTSPPPRMAKRLSVPDILEEPPSPVSPLSPVTPLSPATGRTPADLPKEKVAALRARFDRFAEGSGVRGVLFYPQFILMFCDLFRIPSPQGSHQKWINAQWREIDAERCGSVNFEAFCTWYVKYFDTETGALMRGMPDLLSPSILSAAA
jgi:hypothetical protein